MLFGVKYAKIDFAYLYIHYNVNLDDLFQGHVDMKILLVDNKIM